MSLLQCLQKKQAQFVILDPKKNIYLEPVAFDEFFESVGYEEVMVLIKMSDITSMEPSLFRDSLTRCFLVIQVSLHHLCDKIKSDVRINYFADFIPLLPPKSSNLLLFLAFTRLKVNHYRFAHKTKNFNVAGSK